MLLKIIGKLFVGYAGTVTGVTRCSVTSCHSTMAATAHAVYTFPSWFLAKAVSLVAWRTNVSEIGMLINVRNYSPDGEVFARVSNGDMDKLRLMFHEKKALPNDIEKSWGQTALDVRYILLSNLDFARLIYGAVGDRSRSSRHLPASS